MCETCGCGNTGSNNPDYPQNDNNHDHNHAYTHDHDDYGPHTHHYPDKAGEGLSHKHSGKQVINLKVDVLARNNMTAAMNRRFFEGRKVLCLNMVSSPGSGKTTILEKTINNLSSSCKLYVIEGDQQTNLDADRIEKAGAPAIQINTGAGCHLDAQMIDSAVKKLNPETNSILFIENVGNLVCPSRYDLGEFRRILIISVTEGSDKPLKYPNMFETSHLCLINKSDLLPYVDFQTEEFIRNAKNISPLLEFITVSAKTGDGMDLWYRWVSVLNATN
ncbi:MAG TPA: hydrogenase accessory protein HypB [Bacteroidales bacterium]|nr:hydrogenase accessory protein HypB [Bacteroidales bacterium]